MFWEVKTMPFDRNARKRNRYANDQNYKNKELERYRQFIKNHPKKAKEYNKTRDQRKLKKWIKANRNRRNELQKLRRANRIQEKIDIENTKRRGNWKQRYKEDKEYRNKQIEYSKKSQQKYKEKRNAQMKRWKIKNPEKVKQNKRKRRALEANIQEQYSTEDERFTLDLFAYKCFNCGKAEDLCIDHIYPLCLGFPLTRKMLAFYVDLVIHLNRANHQKNFIIWKD